jgi:hypothetical protein
MNRHPLILLVPILLGASEALAQNESKPRPQPPGGGLIGRVEKASGKELTEAQKEAIRNQGRETRAKLEEQQGIFVRGVSQLFSLPEAKVREYLPKVGAPNEDFDKNMIPKVEKDLGRPITAQERGKLLQIDEAKKSAVRPIQEDLARVISEQSGLSLEDSKKLLPRVGL